MARATTKKAAPKGKAAAKNNSKTTKSAKPSKAITKAKGKVAEKLPAEHAKGKNTPLAAKTVEIVNPRIAISQFHVARINEIESKTHLVSNVAKYMDPVSTGVLCLDWQFNGGVYNGMTSVSGPEGSAKTGSQVTTMGSAIKSGILMNFHIDAEGTINDELATSMLAMVGVSYPELDNLPHKPYRYYKDNVIETIFDFMHSVLRTLPQKVWIPSAESWAYVFDKRDDHQKKMMEAYEVNPEKDLSRHDKYVCLTDCSGLEAGFYLDSFAAMVSIGDDDEDKKSRRRAVEASAFSDNLKRISARLSNRGCFIYGINQLRKTPNVIGKQDPYYEPGGEAIKFFTGQRARFMSVSSGYAGNDAAYNKEFNGIAEKSVIVDGAWDLYDYKSIKNTKNKPGNPNKRTMIRMWKSDHTGNGQGIDPAFDVFNYLLDTGQLLKDRRKLKFNLRKSIGSKRAELLNSLPTFEEHHLKALTLSEVFDIRELKAKALKGMNLSKTVNLRESLFEQIKKDKKVLARNTSSKKKDEDEDYEADGAQEY